MSAWAKLPVASLLTHTIGGVWGAEPGGDEIDVRVLRVTELKAHGRMDPTTAATRSVSERQLSARRLAVGDLLLEKSGGGPNTPVGRVGLVRSLSKEPSICSNFMQLMRPDSKIVIPRYLHLYLNYFHLIGGTESMQTASTNIRNIKSSEFLKVVVPVPDLDEQRRIVEILEDHISRLDAASGDLSGARRRVNLLKASALEWLWSEAECVAERRSVHEIGPVITGATPRDRSATYEGAVLPFVTPGDVRYGEKVVNVTRSLPLDSYSPARVLRTPAVLAVCIGATLGKIGWADRPLATNQQINAVLVGENLPRFVAAMMASPAFQAQMRENASATTMPILNKGAFRKLQLPIPTPAEQRAMLERLDVMLDSTRRLLVAVLAAETRAQNLRRALLATAFSGRLA